MTDLPTFPDGFDYPGYAAYVQSLENPSGDDRKNPDPTSTASGPYQINDPTMTGLQRNYPDANLPAKDDTAMRYLTAENLNALTKAGVDNPTDYGRLYQAHHFGAPTAISMLRGEGATSDSGGSSSASGPPMGANAPATPSATDPYAFLQQLYAQGAAQLGNQKQGIDAYIASQPAMWQKLMDVQKQYQEAAKPTLGDTLNDMFTSYAGLRNAALANKYASTGGILLHDSPDPTPFANALDKMHHTDVQARQARVDLAKTDAQNQTQLGLGQMQQGAANLGLQNSLASEIVKYGLETGKLTTQSIQMGNENAGKLQEAVAKIIPNVDTLNNPVVAQAIIDATKNSPLDLNGNIARVRAVGAAAEAGTLPGLSGPLQIMAKEPAKMMSIETSGPDGLPVRSVVNATTVEGQQALSRAPANARITDLSAPQNNVQVTSGTGSNSGEVGGKGGHSLADQHAAAIQTSQAADAALKILPFLKEAGGTGTITDTPASRVILNAARQALGYDPTNLAPREIYDKLMTQIQVGQILPQMAMLGRGTGGEFNKMLTGQIGGDYTPEAATNFLNHISQTAKWNQRRIEDTSQAAMDAKRGNDNYFDPDFFRVQWQKNPANIPPTWATDDVTNIKPSAPPPLLERMIESIPGGSSIINGVKGAFTPPPPPPAAPRPATGSPPPVSPVPQPGAADFPRQKGINPEDYR